MKNITVFLLLIMMSCATSDIAKPKQGRLVEAIFVKYSTDSEKDGADMLSQIIEGVAKEKQKLTHSPLTIDH